MSKPPPKAGITPTNPQAAVGRIPQTHATTAAQALGPQTAQPNNSKENKNKATSKNKADKVNSDATQPSVTATAQPPLLQVVVAMLTAINKSEKLDSSIRKDLENVIKFAREAEEAENLRGKDKKGHDNVSTICQAVLADLANMYMAIANQINAVQTGCNVIQENTAKVLKEVEEAKSIAKDTVDKVDKVTNTTTKIVSEANSYRDAILSRPSQTNKLKANPKVLSDMDCRAKQILIDIFDNKTDSILNKSLTSIVEKANEILESIEDADKPKDIKVLAALKARKHAILLTLNSKEAAKWLRIVPNEVAFTGKFSAESHIRERLHNLIVPRVPTTFKPGNDEHLRELEETNGLYKGTVRKAKWIKPIGRRRADQTHAYAIISLTSVDFANIIIRDRLFICGTKVRPKKQKQEPIQCMKCRCWGHFASECPSESEVCGNCRDTHRTNQCLNKSKTHCVACGDDTHASWNRNCPEFIRRCHILNERNPENAMPYFPTEYDWSLTVRPDRIPTEDKFPTKYAVNDIPIGGGRHPGPGAGQQCRGKRCNAGSKEVHGNPNHIPISRVREEGELQDEDKFWHTDRPDQDAELDYTNWNTPHDTPVWQ